MNKASRIEWVDAWKGMLILLVVLGHIAGGLCHYTNGDANAIMRYVYRFVYLFHMPAFFMVAGFLWRHKGGFSVGNMVKRRIERLVIPYFVWGVLSAAIFVGAESIARMVAEGSSPYYDDRMFEFPWWRPFVSILHAGGWPRGEGFRCNSVLWFLPCMFVVLVIYEGVERVTRKVRSLGSGLWFDFCMLVIFLVLGAVVRVYAHICLPWELSLAPYMMIFFVIGRLMRRTSVADQQKMPIWFLVVGWLLYGYLAWCYPDLILGYISLKWYGYAVVLATAGCLLSLYTVRAWQISFLARLGVASMGIMLTHKFFIMPIQLGFSRLANLGTIGVVLVAIALLVIVSLISYWVTVCIRRFMPLIVGERR